MTDQTCPQCGASVPDGAAFCTSCGTSLTDPSATAADTSPTGPPEDVTRVEQPGLQGETRVLPETPPSGPAPDAVPSSPTTTPPPPEPAATFAPPPPQPAWGSTPSDQGWGPQPGGPPSSWDAPAPAPSSWDQPGAPAATSWPAASAPTTTEPARAPAGAIVGVVGALLTIVGLFLPWVSANTGTNLSLVGNEDSLTGWALATKAEIRITTNDPYLLLALGILALGVSVLLFVRAAPALRIALAVVGLAIVGLTIYDLSSIRSVVQDTFSNDEKVTPQLGLWLTLGGGIVCIVAACLPAARRSTSS